MQNRKQNFHRVQTFKERRIGSEEQRLQSEEKPQTQTMIAPMSDEMKEVLAGLARFDLLPKESQPSEELILPAIHKKQTGSRRSQQGSLNKDKLYTSINNQQVLRDVESSSRCSGSVLHPVSNPLLTSSPKILINGVTDKETVSSQNRVLVDPGDSARLPSRLRSTTYPWKSRVADPKDEKIFSTVSSHLRTNRDKIKRNLEDSGFNELLDLDAPRRTRAATFPYSYQEVTRKNVEFDDDFGSVSFRDQNILSKGESSSSSSDNKLSMSKYSGKSSPRDQTSAIVNRCEEWFQWREKRKSDKYRR